MVFASMTMSSTATSMDRYTPLDYLGQQRLLTIEEMAAHTQAQRHLPTIQGRDWQLEGPSPWAKWRTSSPSTTETQALYPCDRTERQVGCIGDPERSATHQRFGIQDRQSSCDHHAQLTEQEKAALMNDPGNRFSPAAEQH